MEDSPSPMPAAANPFVPILLLSVAMVLLLSWQCYSAWSTRSNLRTQIELREPMVADAVRINGGMNKLANELLILAESDADAKKVIDKYQIRLNPPAPQ